MKRDISRHLPAMLSCLLLSLLLPAGSVLGQDGGFTGVVVEDEVPVYAGAGPKYYKVGQLQRGEQVRVDEIFFGWNKIVPPEGVYSYVERAFVDAQGDGSVGVVNKDYVKVKAAALSGPGDSFRHHETLNQGDRVRIVGEEGDYYKIVPPQGAFVYLPPGSVRRLADVEAEMTPAGEPVQPRPQPQPATQPQPRTQPAQPQQQSAEEPLIEEEPAALPEEPLELPEHIDVEPWPLTEEPATTLEVPEPAAQSEQQTAEAPATQPVQSEPEPAPEQVEAPQVETPAVSEALRQVEQEMLPLFDLPLAEQPVERMIAAYRNVQSQNLPAVDQRIVRARLLALEHNQQLARVLRTVQQARQNAADSAAAQDDQVLPDTRFDAVGRLMASSVYDGRTLPRLYRLVDPASGRTVAYVQPSDEVGARMMGQIIGVVGRQRYDSALGATLIEVRRAAVLEATRQ